MTDRYCLICGRDETEAEESLCVVEEDDDADDFERSNCLALVDDDLIETAMALRKLAAAIRAGQIEPPRQ